MKIVFAGLLSFCLYSCKQAVIRPTLDGKLNNLQATHTTNEFLNVSFKDLQNNKRFELISNAQYILKSTDTSEVKIYSFKFNSQKKLLSYLLNRRMLLHRSFQDDVAPYFGLIQSENDCLALVKSKADFIQLDKNSEYFEMQFPTSKQKTILDCHQKEIWGLVQFNFYNCKSTNEVFEVRQYRELNNENLKLNFKCD